MADLYVAKTVLSALLDSSRSLVLVENEPALKLKGFETELWGCLGLQKFGNDLLIGPSPGEKDRDVQRIESLGQHVIAVVVSPNSSISESFTALAFVQAAPLPLIEASDAAQALGGLLQLAFGARKSHAAALSSALRKISEIRDELERSEEISAGALQTLGLRSLGEARLVASRAPVPNGPVFACAPAQPPIRQISSLVLANLTAVAVHLAGAACGDGSSVTIRLVSADSQICHGSWSIPGRELKPGWLVLNLRSVIGPVLETAALEILPSLGLDDKLVFSLDSEEFEHRLSVDFGHGPSGACALCLQFFSAEFGSRNVLPRYWDWEACGVARPFFHAPHHLPPEAWLGAELVEGEGEFVAIGAEPPRPVIRVATGRRAVVRLPNCAFENCDLVEIGLSVYRSPSNFVRVRFSIEALKNQGTVETAFRSEWKTLGGTDEMALFASRLPQGGRSVNLSLEAELARGQGPVTLEWTSVTGLKLPPEDLKRLTLTPLASDSVVGSAQSEMEKVLDVKQMQRPNHVFSGVKVDHIFCNDAGTYRHIDLIVYDFFAGETLLPVVRFKIAEAGIHDLLEFRNGPDWPDVFETWPSTSPDTYGPVFRLESDLDHARSLLSQFTAKDKAFLAHLCEKLPEVVASAARDANLDKEATASWIAAARRLSRISLLAQE